ncbi:MAG: 3-isopropylmalate dehydratase small subunit [Flavobacteriia bacterium]|nr:3-isopropylmalate dehydratase small subunit [Flavobacteriia bacterium]
MEKFERLISNYTLLETENIDTDQIIPAVHLKSIERINFGKYLFSNWRNEGKLDEIEWPRNGTTNKVLVAGSNFGCGSSREHAVWALSDYGFKVILSTQIADIFSLNALNNGVLPIKISEELYRHLIKLNNTNCQIEIDLETQEVILDSVGKKEKFKISEFKRECLLNGFDTIDYLVSIYSDIENYEQAR